MLPAVVSDFALGPDGDLLITQGELQLVTGDEAIAQDWALRMRLFRGEWCLDRRAGTDFQAQVFESQPQRVVLRHIFERITRETAGIRSVDSLELAFDGRSRLLTVTVQATADSGSVLQLDYNNVLFDEGG